MNRKTITRRSLALVAVIGACSYATIATAQINFNLKVVRSGHDVGYAGLGVAPDLAGDSATNWNLLTINSGQTEPIIVTNLVSSSGVTFTGVDLTFSNVTAGGQEKAWDDTGGGAPPNPVDLMRAYTYQGPYHITVSGLAPGNYDFWYFGHGDQPDQQGTITIDTNNGGGTFTTTNGDLGRDLINGGLGVAYTNFTGLTVGNDGTFSFTTAYLNGFQLQPSQPEGPAFMVTGGAGCSGVDVGVSGSVTTNVYMLYLDGVYAGTTVAGTGAALSLAVVSIPGTYTVVASNTVTAATGLMYGVATVYTPGIAINTQPASVSVVTNLPASFSVQAMGNALTYQWYKNGVALTNGGNISGATTANLIVSPAGAADEATSANGYTVQIQDPCGTIATSSPPVALTLMAPRDLIWTGGNPGSDWNFTDQEFTLSGNPAAFQEGDNVTFNDSSSYQSVTISNNLTPTLITVTGTKNYTFSGPKKITGISQLMDGSSGTLTILNANDFTGGTIVTNGGTLQLGDATATGNDAQIAGMINLASGTTLRDNYYGGGNITAANSLSGSGTADYMFTGGSSRTITLGLVNNTNFTGTNIVEQYTRLEVTTAAAEPAGPIVVNDGGSFYSHVSGFTNMNPISIIGIGPGSSVDTPQGKGALRLGNAWGGPIALTGDATIGGGTATILGNITDGGNNFTLTNAGGTIQIGPLSGTNSYGDTVISEDYSGNYVNVRLTTVQALNSHPFGTGPVHMIGDAQLQLNGNNLSIPNLIDDTLALGGTNISPTIANGSSSQAATLTVGSDNNSQSFTGSFLDGDTQPLGLTKVGTGTLTLSGDSTSTGPVTVSAGTLALAAASGSYYTGQPILGSGSFSNASAFAVADGATLDVSGRSDGTLTLNAGQTLEHSGTTTGTIHITGNVDLGNGTLLLGVNHTGLASDSLTASGSITYSGTLAVTNIGGPLQAGDSFQLFSSSGVSGFTAFNLETDDYVNNVKYTWNNTVASNGKITVLSVGSLVNPNPAPISASVTDGKLTLQWPPDRTGWTLQAQTNTMNGGLGTNWVNVAGSTGTNQMVIPINSTNGSVFFRMVYTNTP